MRPPNGLEDMLIACDYERAMGVAESFITGEEWDRLEILVDTSANLGRASFLTDLAFALLEHGEVERGMGVAILAACITSKDELEVDA